MSETRIPVGRVLRASNRGFTVGCRVMQPDIPAFGSFVRADARTPDGAIYGLIYDVTVQDDLFVRRFVMVEPPEEVVRDQRENRQVPIEVSVLAVGYRTGDRIVHAIPPQPPVTMDYLYPCSPDEIVAFTRRFDYFRLVLDAPGVPADELIATSLLAAAAARPAEERMDFLVEAGRELTRLLANDLIRLDGLLQRIRSATE
ncbi:MAG TPA: hypothetical protein ENK08_00055 [Chloroflexi bacterium]|nr:hypothetical protein [Chloroflexota bacterium]